MRRLVPVVVAAVIALSGCTPFACPAIGYLSTLDVRAPLEVAAVSCADCDENFTEFEQVEPGAWRLRLIYPAESLTLVAIDAAGAEIFRTEVEPVWVADDPGAQCGSPLTSEPIELRKK